MGLRLMCVAGVALVALLLLLTAAILRLALLLMQLVSMKYSLAVCMLALAVWFVDSRRQCYAKGFYSCSRVPQAAALEQKREEVQPDEEQEQEEEDRQEETQPQQSQETASVVPVALPVAIKKVATAPPSETESEDDDSEASGVSSVRKTPSSSSARHNQSLVDVRTRSHTTDGELQRRQATRPRSSSAVGDSRSNRAVTRAAAARSSNASAAERKRKMSRRRADTGMASSSKHGERSRRATFTSKQDALTASSRSNSEMLEDALRSDGYWIGDFSVQRRLVSRRGYANSPKAN